MSTAIQAVSFRPARKHAALPAFSPMLALSASAIPANGKDWAFEYKWDGVRAVFYHKPGAIRVLARSGNVITDSYPELAVLGPLLRKHQVVLDGEIVSLDERHRPSFAKLQRRMHVRNPSETLMAETPVFFVVFDVLYLDGETLVDETYAVRRKRLESLELATPYSGIGPSHVDRGKVMLKTAAERGLEGVVAKKLDSKYLAGLRSPNWLKLKVIQRQEFVIGGWTPQDGSPGRVGSLLLGYYEEGQLRFAGRIGSGFSEEEHRRLSKIFKGLESKSSPFDEAVNRLRGTSFLKPELVAEVEYRRWPAGGMVQHGVYKGLRDDKDARKVVKEHAQQAI
jgi:bifunctional non-homologous end joining protein LigD